MGISETGGNMVKTLKKMILHTKDDLDKPNFRGHESDFNPNSLSERHNNEDRFGPSDDYHIPEPEDIRRMPTPGFQEPPVQNFQSGYNQEHSQPVNQNTQQNNFDYRRDQPIPMPQRQSQPIPRQPTYPSAPAPQPHYQRNIEDTLNQILYRLDDIERRLSQLESYGPQPPAPQPRRY